MRLHHLLLGLLDGCRVLQVLALGVVQVLLRQRVLLHQRLGAREICRRDLHRRLLLLQGRLGAASTCAWNGFLSMRNNTWPCLDERRPRCRRACRESRDTRAAMLTACELCVCATNTDVTGTSRGVIVSAVTSVRRARRVLLFLLAAAPTTSSEALSATSGSKARAGRVQALTRFMGGPSSRCGRDGTIRRRRRRSA